MVVFDPESGNVNFNPYSFIGRPCSLKMAIFQMLMVNKWSRHMGGGEMILEGGQMEAHVLDCNDDHDHGDDHHAYDHDHDGDRV